MKRNIVLTLYVIVLVFVMNTIVAAQQSQKPGAEWTQYSAPSASSKSTTDEDAAVEQLREDMRSERRKIVAANVPLTEAEAPKFWAVYDQYRAKAAEIYDVRYALIKQYAKNYDTMTEAQADAFIERWLSCDGDDTQLRLRYIPEFEKVISHRKTAMFFQVDQRVSLMFFLRIAARVPLVNPTNPQLRF